LSQPYDLGGPEFACTVSIGIVLFRGQDSDTKLLLKHADMALYQAKNAGRNIVHFYDDAMQARLDEHASLEHELQLALTRQEFLLVYQPQINHMRRVISAEALLRWNHPQRGLLEPDAFIKLAEESGVILPIGRWVLATACAQIKLWSELAETEVLTLAVNVSARQFHQKEFVSEVEQALADSGADPKHLILELTESQVIHDVPDAIAKMQAIKALGVGLAMDDFGTGYSSLSILSSLPLDQLKIDQSFIHKLDNSLDTNNAIVTQSIITLAQMLGLQVMAEGVETETQLDFLERLGCSDYQGYLFSKPLTLHDFENTAFKLYRH
jgi:EAL domain-containing protein (putative c-di-GMP-specific phosphodiesterase class I)